MDKDKIRCQLEVSVLLRYRDLPVSVALLLYFDEVPESVEDLTDYATSIMLEKLDSMTELWFPLEDAGNNKQIIRREDIQSLFIMAPTSIEACVVDADD